MAHVEAAHTAGEVDEGVAVDVGERGAAAFLDHNREIDRQRVGDDTLLASQNLAGSRPRYRRLQLDRPRHRHASDDTRATGGMNRCIGPIHAENLLAGGRFESVWCAAYDRPRS